jgi:hypothetical protein
MTGPRICLFPLWLLVGASLLPAVSTLAPQRTLHAEEAASPADSRAASEGILVMRTGAIIQGKILQSGGVYDVHTANGKMAVPETLVKIRAANLTEAYEQLHDGAVSQQSANAHVLLAHWCLANQLHREARAESQAALKLEPDREDAKRLMRNADEALQADEAPTASIVVHEDPARAARQAAAAAEDAVSLGGMSRDQALQFARRIQPMLVNNCTAAGCHGRESQTGFRLSKVTPGKGANRHAAERNLAEVLEWIDVKKPRSSRLLTAPRGNHGRRGRPIFAGSRGDEQLAELEKWIVAVAAEETVRDRHDPDEARPKKSVRPMSAAGEDGTVPRGRQPAGARHATVAEKPSWSAANGSRPGQQPLPAGRGDPFDAAVFNRGADRSVR